MNFISAQLQYLEIKLRKLLFVQFKAKNRKGMRFCLNHFHSLVIKTKNGILNHQAECGYFLKLVNDFVFL